MNEEALLIDKNSNLIEMQDFDCEYLSDISFSKNDYALNTLIGICLKKYKYILFRLKMIL